MEHGIRKGNRGVVCTGRFWRGLFGSPLWWGALPVAAASTLIFGLCLFVASEGDHAVTMPRVFSCFVWSLVCYAVGVASSVCLRIETEADESDEEADGRPDPTVRWRLFGGAALFLLVWLGWPWLELLWGGDRTVTQAGMSICRKLVLFGCFLVPFVWSVRRMVKELKNERNEKG